MHALLIVLTTVVGCSKGSPPSSSTHGGPANTREIPESPSPPGSQSMGIIVGNGELRRFSADQPSRVLAAVPVGDACDVDKTHNVVWLLGGGAMHAYDRETKKTVKIASGLADHTAWAVRYQDAAEPSPTQVAGNVNGLEHCVAVVLSVSNTPSVGGEYVGEGDREVYCGEYDSKTENMVLFAETRQQMAKYSKAALTNVEAVRTFAARRGRNSAVKREPRTAPSPPTLTIDKSRCTADPEDCGQLEYLGGGRIWRVTTGNSRGDFYHEQFQIYDTRTEMFWNLDNGARQPAPFEDGAQMFGFDVAPDGSWATYEGKVFSFDRATEVGPLEGTWCGWE